MDKFQAEVLIQKLLIADPAQGIGPLKTDIRRLGRYPITLIHFEHRIQLHYKFTQKFEMSTELKESVTNWLLPWNRVGGGLSTRSNKR